MLLHELCDSGGRMKRKLERNSRQITIESKLEEFVVFAGACAQESVPKDSGSWVENFGVKRHSCQRILRK